MNYIKSTVVTATNTLLQLILWTFSTIIYFLRFPSEILKCEKITKPKSLQGCKKEIIKKLYSCFNKLMFTFWSRQDQFKLNTQMNLYFKRYLFWSNSVIGG